MTAAWDKAHPEKMREYKRRYRERNREKLRVDALRRFYLNHERNLARGKEWAARNPDKVRAAGRRHDAKPHRKNQQRGDYKARQARYRAKHLELVRARRRAYEAKRRSDPAQRVVDAIRRRIRHVLNGNAKGSLRILGYTADELKIHLAAKFQPGMTWENYGLYGNKWHVDHIRPVSSFKLPDELVACFALENLCPLWASENLAKGRRLQFRGQPHH